MSTGVCRQPANQVAYFSFGRLTYLKNRGLTNTIYFNSDIPPFQGAGKKNVFIGLCGTKSYVAARCNLKRKL
jgi:hypothetical protein